MDKLHVFVHMLMRDASLKQRIPHTHLNFWELFQWEKSKHYTRVNMICICMYVCMYVCICIRQIAFKMHLLVIKDKLMLFLFLL